jgi:DNA-binding MarR family transcriptional regulator
VSDAIHPTSQLDDTVHQRVRLGLLAVLTEADSAEFTYLRERLDLTDGNLSRHLHVLEQAGYVSIEKVTEGRRSRTWIHATRQGRRAFAEHLDRLQALIDMAGGNTATERGEDKT